LKITPPEYMLMRTYIEAHCGIHLEQDKEYLIESRLSDLAAESGCRSFQEFHFKARTDYTGRLKERIIDAITTNETSWFRDKSLWDYLEQVAVPRLIEKITRTGKARIWSSAVSTGQEIYSLMMLLDRILQERGLTSFLNRFEIFATDISTAALETAVAGRYDAIAMDRGLPTENRERYFTPQDRRWEFDSDLRSRVQFKKFNLQNSFLCFTPFDLVLCRYVSIYFSVPFKRELFSKMATVLTPGGVLVLGATESLREFSSDFEISYFNNAVINTRK